MTRTPQAVAPSGAADQFGQNLTDALAAFDRDLDHDLVDQQNTGSLRISASPSSSPPPTSVALASQPSPIPSRLTHSGRGARPLNGLPLGREAVELPLSSAPPADVARIGEGTSSTATPGSCREVDARGGPGPQHPSRGALTGVSSSRRLDPLWVDGDRGAESLPVCRPGKARLADIPALFSVSAPHDTGATGTTAGLRLTATA